MNNVNSIREFFDFLNEKCEYLVLRNWDDIFDEGIYGSGHEDIDILCRSLDEFIQLTGAKRVHSSHYRDNFYVNIGTMRVRFDVRHVGDGYYPREWQNKMLNNRVLIDQKIYIMDNSDYVYSLAYHALIQKARLSEEYLSKIKNAFTTLKGVRENIQSTDILVLLKMFCADNNYQLEIPSDPGVFLNRKNIRGFTVERNFKYEVRRFTLRFQQWLFYILRKLYTKLICQK